MQLLTQIIVGTYGYDTLISIRNNAINMLVSFNLIKNNFIIKTDLDNEYHNTSKDERYSFYISNLADSIYSCHDILGLESVDFPTTLQPFIGDYVNNDFIKGFSECRHFTYLIY